MNLITIWSRCLITLFPNLIQIDGFTTVQQTIRGTIQVNEYTCDSIARKEHETINDHIKKAFVIKMTLALIGRYRHRHFYIPKFKEIIYDPGLKCYLITYVISSS